MEQKESMEILSTLSDGLAAVVAAGEKAVVTIRGTGGYPTSGTVYRPGLFLSSNQALGQDEGLSIVLPDGVSHEAEVVGRDPRHDLVLLRTKETVGEAPQTREGPLRVGEVTVSLARPTDEGTQASLGIVNVAKGAYRSWRSRPVQDVLRIDVRRYPGYSGGPVLDTRGRAVGISVLGDAGVAVPIEMAWSIAGKLEKGESMGEAYLGIRSQPAQVPKTASLDADQTEGLLVVGLEEGGPAEIGGILVGDIVVGFAGERIGDHGELLERLEGQSPGATVEIRLVRGGESMVLSVELGTRPAEQAGHHRGRRGGPPHGHWSGRGMGAHERHRRPPHHRGGPRG